MFDGGVRPLTAVPQIQPFVTLCAPMRALHHGFANKIYARYSAPACSTRRLSHPRMRLTARKSLTMNPASSAQLSRTAPYQSTSSSTAAIRPNARPSVRRQLFIDDINQAIGDDAKLKEQYPSQGLQHEELTALRRERDRLAPMCTDDAGALELAPHLGKRVTRLLTAAVHGVGLTIADHQAQQLPSVSFHVQ